MGPCGDADPQERGEGLKGERDGEWRGLGLVRAMCVQRPPWNAGTRSSRLWFMLGRGKLARFWGAWGVDPTQITLSGTR